MHEANEQLVRLGELSDYKVADGDPDPRGWDVVSADGQRIGHVDDLIVDRASERAHFLDVQLDHAADRHVLIPTESVHLGRDEQDRQQVAVGATLDYLTRVTPYRGLPLTTEQHQEYRSCPTPGFAYEKQDTRIHRGATRHG